MEDHSTNTYELTMYPGEPGDHRLDRLRRQNLILKLLGLTVGKIDEYRDAWLERTSTGDLRVAIYTQLGGSVARRTVHREQIEILQGWPLYLGDANDEFLAQYATFYFRLPEGIPEDIMTKLEAAAVEVVDTSDRWRTALERWREQLEADGTVDGE